jgi:hypothetical protein
MIRGNVVLNTLSARSIPTLLRDQICINSLSRRQVSGFAELSYTTGFVSIRRIKKHGMKYIDLLFVLKKQNGGDGHAARADLIGSPTRLARLSLPEQLFQMRLTRGLAASSSTS